MSRIQDIKIILNQIILIIYQVGREHLKSNWFDDAKLYWRKNK